MSLRLHEARTRVLPMLVFGVAGMVAVMLWKDSISPAMLVGEVTTVKSTINSPVAATVRKLHAQRLQMVRAGDVVAELAPNDPKQSLDMLQSELSLLRIEASAAESTTDSSTAARREALDYERLKLDWMSEKVALVTAQAQAKRTTLELEMAKGMITAPAGSKRYLQEAELAKETADAELAARKTLVEELEGRLKTLKPVAVETTTAQVAPWRSAMASLEERMRTLDLNQSVVALRAPIDGIVTEILRRTGENVVQGEILVTITATRPETIVGYLRQPFPMEPTVGQAVEVRTHGRERMKGMAVVTRVGVHFEPILNPALHPAVTPEVGLPMEVSLPANLRLRPGELVSLVIRPAAEGDAL